LQTICSLLCTRVSGCHLTRRIRGRNERDGTLLLVEDKTELRTMLRKALERGYAWMKRRTAPRRFRRCAREVLLVITD